MLTLSRVIAFIIAYRTAHAGELPPYVEMSEEEAAQLLEDPRVHLTLTHSAVPLTIHGVPIRIV